MINYEDNEIIKKNSIISVNIDACRIIDDYGFSYYMEYFGENLSISEIEKLALLEDI